MKKISLNILILISSILTSTGLFAESSVPVIFVHGRNAGPGVWGPMISSLKAQGFIDSRLYTWDYDTSQSTNEVLASQFGSYVSNVLRQTRSSQVDIVAHSLGSLPTRWYIEFGGGEKTVRNWISLAGPNHGTKIAFFCALWDQGCRDMTPNSYVLRNLNRDFNNQPVRYWTFWSRCDEQIIPQKSTILEGANNNQVGCLKHNDQLSDPTISSRVGAILSRP